MTMPMLASSHFCTVSRCFSADALEAVSRTANEQMATLVASARFFVAKDSGHDIHQDQPEM
jgi:hypothetical protein